MKNTLFAIVLGIIWYFTPETGVVGAFLVLLQRQELLLRVQLLGVRRVLARLNLNLRERLQAQREMSLKLLQLILLNFSLSSKNF
jgi:hypothetical protein